MERAVCAPRPFREESGTNSWAPPAFDFEGRRTHFEKGAGRWGSPLKAYSGKAGGSGGCSQSNPF